MLDCWLIKHLNVMAYIAIMCACLQTNSQRTHIAHTKMAYVAGMKRKWHGCDRMVHMPMALVWTTHTKMHQVSFFTITWTVLSGFYKLTAFVNLMTYCYATFPCVSIFYTALSFNIKRYVSFVKFWTLQKTEMIQGFWLFLQVFICMLMCQRRIWGQVLY
jgi:hypothetical protein